MFLFLIFILCYLFLEFYKEIVKIKNTENKNKKLNIFLILTYC